MSSLVLEADREVHVKAMDPKTEFLKVFEVLSADLRKEVDARFDLPEFAKEYVAHNVQYNVPHGKLNRGLAVVQYVKDYYEKEKKDLDEQVLFQACTLGWCVEFLQAFFLVADDIMDASLTRRGQPCFYKLPDVGLKAINDSIILEAFIFELLRKHLRQLSCYVELVDLFHEITFTTSLGQMLDLSTEKAQGDVDLSAFNEDNLVRIFKYKTAHYSFYLPVALGMHLCGITDAQLFETTKEICIEMGVFFQAQDDYLDCFGDPEVTGKVGTDIEDNKCTWLVVEALKVADANDRSILQENYGRGDPEKVAKVKALYTRLEVPKRFLEYEDACYASLVSKIEAAKPKMQTGAVEFLLNKIFKRSK